MTAVGVVDPDRWRAELDDLTGRVGSRFARVETRRTAGRMLAAMVSELPAKNCWSLAEHAGDTSPDAMQHLLSSAVVDDEAHLEELIAGKPGMNRFLRVTPAGKLRVDATKVKAEANFDGQYLLRCSDPKLSAADIAVGYKQLLEVERGWRDMKSVPDLRPVYHRLEERIRAHVILCWLALLLVRVAETRTATTWQVMRRELDRIHVGTFTGPTGVIRRTTTLTKAHTDLLARLGAPKPKQIVELTPVA
ncbi:hypothetical protein OG225_14905 [Nocardia sp. NBC_01377]|uniref:IS1634 family transposase n=1 Tax=Nocardia sp. NBC_01377 TaxID=2903595 RepID=UPI00324621DC